MMEKGRVMSFHAKPGGEGPRATSPVPSVLDWAVVAAAEVVVVEEAEGLLSAEVKLEMACSRSQPWAERISVHKSGSSRPVIA